MKPATRAPFYASIYHGLAEVARKHGYALAIHGTVTSDLDLIAVPYRTALKSVQPNRKKNNVHTNRCSITCSKCCHKRYNYHHWYVLQPQAAESHQGNG